MALDVGLVSRRARGYNWCMYSVFSSLAAVGVEWWERLLIFALGVAGGFFAHWFAALKLRREYGDWKRRRRETNARRREQLEEIDLTIELLAKMKAHSLHPDEVLNFGKRRSERRRAERERQRPTLESPRPRTVDEIDATAMEEMVEVGYAAILVGLKNDGLERRTYEELVWHAKANGLAPPDFEPKL